MELALTGSASVDWGEHCESQAFLRQHSGWDGVALGRYQHGFSIHKESPRLCCRRFNICDVGEATPDSSIRGQALRYG